MRVFVRMIGPVLVRMGVHCTSMGQFLCAMRMRTLKVVYVVVSAPHLLWIKVGNQQAFTVMPAITEDIVILLALRRALILTQTVPFAMWVLLNALRDNRSCHYPITGCLEEETEVDIHQTVKAKLFINPSHFRQQFAPECHQIALDGISIRPSRLLKFAQITAYQSERSGNPDAFISQSLL